MRNQWYGDERDLVKWGTLLHLAKTKNAGRIVQVAYFRPDEKEYALYSKNGSFQIDPAILNHFRDLDDIQRLSESSGIEIDVFKDPFDGMRNDYHNRLTQYLVGYSDPQIVFLDPDTGIAPANFNYKHVKPGEIRTVFDSLKTGDILVFYQHARQRVRTWREDTLNDFIQALDKTEDEVDMITGNGIANDVAFFIAEK